MQRKRVKFTSGVKIGNVVRLKGTGSMRKLRCPHCHGMAQPAAGQKGVVRCATCRTSFKVASMG